MQELEYTARMTGEPYLFRETRVVAKLMLDGLSREEIIEKVKNNNLFNYRTGKSVNKEVNAIYARLSNVDNRIVKAIAEESIERSKILIIYVLMKTNRLFFEFMKEVYNEKIRIKDFNLDKEDINHFFNNKKQESEVIAKWYDSTFAKLRQVFIKTLAESGLINNTKDRKIIPIIFDDFIFELLKEIGDESYYYILLGDDEC